MAERRIILIMVLVSVDENDQPAGTGLPPSAAAVFLASDLSKRADRFPPEPENLEPTPSLEGMSRKGREGPFLHSLASTSLTVDRPIDTCLLVPSGDLLRRPR
jgi:hypothetical protein